MAAGCPASCLPLPWVVVVGEVEAVAAHGVGRNPAAEGPQGACKEGLASLEVPAVASHTLLGPGAASEAGTQHRDLRHHHQLHLQPIAGAWAAAAEEAAAAEPAADPAVGGLEPPAAVPVPVAVARASHLAAAAAA